MTNEVAVPRSRWLHRLAWLAYLVPAMSAALLLGPQRLVRAPSFDGLLGTPAKDDVKASFDLDLIDEATTEAARDAAAAKSRPVFDLDTRILTKKRTRLQDAFAQARAAIADGRPDVPALFEEKAGLSLSEEQRRGLQERTFGPEVQEAWSSVLGQLSGLLILADPGHVSGPPQRITVEHLGGTTERTLVEWDKVQDLADMERQIGALLRDQPGADAATVELLKGLVLSQVEANLTPNWAETEKARARARDLVQPVRISVRKGEMVVRDGEKLSQRHLAILRAVAKSTHGGGWDLIPVGGFLLVLLVACGGLLLAQRFATSGGFELRPKDHATIAMLLALGLLVVKLWSELSRLLSENLPEATFDSLLYAMPVAVGAMLVRMVLRIEVALWFSVLAGVAIGIVTPHAFWLYVMVGGTVGALAIRNISSRNDLLRAGLWTALAQILCSVALELLSPDARPTAYPYVLGASLLGGLTSAGLVLALTPILEAVFGYTTDLRLLELANLNHPALKELIVQAPGSYHHSIMVGTLVEAAAEAVGANPLLARVMAYYHDLGKGCNPMYFIENQREGQNPHDKLNPNMSAIIIKRHVTDGLEIARKYGLGVQIESAIVEHHGTTLIHYFFHKAVEREGEDSPPGESEFRYPGRKPQTREAALVMLGDSIEAAARSLDEPDAARLQGLVTRIINLKFTDGQLAECDLTLKDLHHIAKAFSHALTSIYHQRLQYPRLLDDLDGKKHGHPDHKTKKRGPGDDFDPTQGTDNLRRLGM